MSLEEKKFVNPMSFDNTSEFATADEGNPIGNFGQPDVPGYSASEMQKVMDKLPRYIASRVNEIVDEIAEHGADSITVDVEGIPESSLADALLWLKEHGGGVQIPSGTSAPSGGSDGDFYFQYSAT